MSDWPRTLARHCQQTRARYPGDSLLMVLDIGQATASQGKVHDIDDAIAGRLCRNHIQLASRGVNDEGGLSRFLASDIQWADIHMRPNSVSPHDFINGKTTAENPGGLCCATDCVAAFSQARPGAVVATSVDFPAPLILGAPNKAQHILDAFLEWGINRLSLGWQVPNVRRLIGCMQHWGYELHVHGTPRLRSLAEAVMLQPGSITWDINISMWNDDKPAAVEGENRYGYAISGQV